MGPLHGTGQDGVGGLALRGVDGDEIALPFEGLVAPGVADDLQRFVDLILGVLPLDTAERQLLFGGTPGRAQIEASLGDHVEHGRPLGHPNRVVVAEGHAHGPVTDPDPLGLSGHGSEEYLRGGHVRVLHQRVVLDRPDSVEAHLLGVDRLIDTVLDRRMLAFRGGIFELGLEDHRELHVLFSSCCRHGVAGSVWSQDLTPLGPGPERGRGELDRTQ